MSQSIHIDAIPAFSDNYIWCIHDERVAVVVDPGDAAPVNQYLQRNKLALTGILITHHHWDHTNGIAALADEWPGVPVWGPAHETISGMTHPLRHGDTVTLPLGLRLQVLEIPGHTAGHLGYYSAHFDGKGPVLFCGDTLFSSGCGRLFEGTAEQMYHSLRLLRELPLQTKVYCTHEYTQSNLKFALAVEPENQQITKRVAQVAELRDQGQPSLPSTIELELEVNPFLRVEIATVIDAIARNCGTRPAGDIDAFAKLRLWKDRF